MTPSVVSRYRWTISVTVFWLIPRSRGNPSVAAGNFNCFDDFRVSLSAFGCTGGDLAGLVVWKGSPQKMEKSYAKVFGGYGHGDVTRREHAQELHTYLGLMQLGLSGFCA